MPRHSRIQRRQAEWLASVQAFEAAGLSPKEARAEARKARGKERVPPIVAADPRRGDDRRQQERRRDGDPETLTERMRAAGIMNDRRQGDRRQKDRRT
jgi:3-mercaptopyruvate sulfurtransferase SseA